MKGALRWISVRRILEGALRYWIATSSRDDGPHVIQQWAAWVDDTLYFGGSDKTRWSRHLRLDPRRGECRAHRVFDHGRGSR